MPIAIHISRKSYLAKRKRQIHCAAMLFRNCLCLCVFCNSNRSTANLSRSFFCMSLFSSAALDAALPDGPAPDPAIRPRSELPGGWLRVDDDRLSGLEESRPSCSSHFALRPCSRRASFSTWFDDSVRRWAILGVISSRRDCCASRNVGSGRSSKC